MYIKLAFTKYCKYFYIILLLQKKFKSGLLLQKKFKSGLLLQKKFKSGLLLQKSLKAKFSINLLVNNIFINKFINKK
jgi:hypothetical protein